MRFKSRQIVAILLVAASVMVVAQQPSPAEALFQRGLLLERAEGNLTQAALLYERVVAEYPKDSVVVPQALYRLAQVYEKIDGRRGALMWTRLATEFGSSQYGDEARRRVAALQRQIAGALPMRSLDSVATGLPDFAYSPDARTVAYIRSEGARGQLILRDLDSGRERQVVVIEPASEPGEPIWSSLPVWSPDGQRLIFFVSNARSDLFWTLRPKELRMVTAATLQVQTLGRLQGGAEECSWSPDSQRVAYVSRTPGPPRSSTFEIVSVASGETRSVSSPAVLGKVVLGIAWSADSRELAFSTISGQQVDEFWIASADAGHVRPLPMSPFVFRPGNGARTDLRTGLGSPWKANGQILVERSDPSGVAEYLIPAAGGSETKTCTSGRLVACWWVTPDGSVQVVEYGATHRVMLLDVVKGSERRVSGGFDDEERPMVSPDGRLIAFLSNRPGNGKWGVYVVPIDKAPVAEPLLLGVLDEHPDYFTDWGPARAAARFVWSPDGRLVVSFSRDDDHVFRINLDRTGRATGPAERLTQDTEWASMPAVSPDGARIAYRYGNGAKEGIAVMTADGSGEHPVFESEVTSQLQWLSGDEVLFQKPEGRLPGSIAAINVKTGAARPFADLRRDNWFPWQFVPSRNEIVYWEKAATGQSGRLRARSLADGTDREIATIDSSLGILDFRVSPDGQRIAYSRGVGLESTTARAETRVVAIDGRDDRILTSAPGHVSQRSLSWSPDGQLLAFAGAKVMDVRTGASWAIAEAPDGNERAFSQPQWAPDGSFIVLFRSVVRNEYRAWDGVTYDAVVKLLAAGVKK